MSTSRTPYSTQFITYCTGGDTAPNAVNIKKYIPEAADARLYVASYTIRLAAFACEDEDILAGKALASVLVKWSDATAMFPIAYDRGASGGSDITLTLSLKDASAAQFITFEASGLGAGHKLSLFWELIGEN